MKVLPARQLHGAPRVSVVIPHYNYGRYLPTAVRSAFDQRGVDVDVVVVDDRSTDGSTELARAVAATDDRIQLVVHGENMRHIRTYNDGLSRATGDYVVLLSADDALTPNSLSRAVALMEHHPEVGIVYGAVEWFSEDLPRGGRPTSAWWQTWRGEEWIEKVARRGRNAIVNPEVVMRRSVLEKTGGYDTRFPHAADLLMWLQAAASSDVGYVGGPRQASYRSHGQNMHVVDFGGLLDDMTQVLEVFEHFFATDGSQLESSGSLLGSARLAVAREAVLRGLLLVSQGQERDVLLRFQAFARRTAPEIVESPTWRWADWASRGGARGRLARSSEQLRWKLRSRRGDLVGL